MKRSIILTLLLIFFSCFATNRDLLDANHRLIDGDNFENHLDENSLQSASVWGDLIKISVNSTRHSAYPSIAYDKDNNVHVVWGDKYNYTKDDTDDMDIFYKVYNEKTQLWSKIELVSNFSEKESEKPEIAVDSNLNVHVVWKENLDINYIKRHASNNSWGKKKNLTPWSGESECPRIVIDSLDNIHITWHDDTTSYGDSDLDVLSISWINQTNSWTAPFLVSSTSWDESRAPCIGVDSNNRVFIVWYDLTDVRPYSKLLYRRRNSDGSWSSVLSIFLGNEMSACYPSIAFDNLNNMHLTWHDAIYDDIYYKRRSSTGVWTATQFVTEGSFTFLSTDNQNNVHLCYGKFDLKYMVGVDDVWIDNEEFAYRSTFILYSIVKSVTNEYGDVYIVWNDNSEGVMNIYLKKLTCDYIPPEIIIDRPKFNEVYGEIPPQFKVTIRDRHLNDTWYTLNDIGHQFFEINETIDQALWEQFGSETIEIKFYANDTFGNFNYDSVTVIKDLEPPSIIINSPVDQELYGFNPPNFDISITDEIINTSWYCLSNTTHTSPDVFFQGFSGTINQTLWNLFNNGTVTIIFYANDSLGHLSSQNVTIRKDIIDPTWLQIPSNQYNEFSSPFHYNVNASDPSGIDAYWINDTINFQIDDNGIITNYTILTLGAHWLQVSVNDTLGNFITTIIKITVQDTTDPMWDEMSLDQIIEFGTSLNYEVNASDPSGIDTYWINDTVNFQIDNYGIISNLIVLIVGEYWIEVSVNDTLGNFITTIIKITVQDTTDPMWDEMPLDQIIEFGASLNYEVNASDLSGIDTYWINDTVNFQIDNNGIITNKVALSEGDYCLQIRAYDPYGNYVARTIKITVKPPQEEPIPPGGIPGYNAIFIISILGILTIALIIWNKKRSRLKL